MDREINLDSIRALDEQIEEHEKAITQLKRTRNSLLNVSTLLPPEILGNIFRWNVIPDGDFGGLSEDSYNFLLVCRHWFEVASRTPELWYFRGNLIPDWSKRYSRCGYSSLDLVASSVGWTTLELGEPLRDALQDRTAWDAIRQVHLRGVNGKIIESIISLMITPGEGVLSNSVESFVLRNVGCHAVDVSRFFARYDLPKSGRLDLSGMCRISSRDLHLWPLAWHTYEAPYFQRAHNLYCYVLKFTMQSWRGVMGVTGPLDTNTAPIVPNRRVAVGLRLGCC